MATTYIQGDDLQQRLTFSCLLQLAHVVHKYTHDKSGIFQHAVMQQKVLYCASFI
jgi:hypothetical protein